jgi:hypothetical protein
MIQIQIAILIINTLLIIGLYIYLATKKSTESFLSQNPGCDVNQQAACTQAERNHEIDPSKPTCDQSNPKLDDGKTFGGCCSCSDYEGEDCVPKNCAKTACVKGKCGK